MKVKTVLVTLVEVTTFGPDKIVVSVPVPKGTPETKLVFTLLKD